MADDTDPPKDEENDGKMSYKGAKDQANDDKDETNKSLPTTDQTPAHHNKTKPDESIQPVKLNTVQTRYKIHQKSTLPDVLTEYGLEDKSIKKKVRRKKKKSSSDLSDDDNNGKNKEEMFRAKFGDNRVTDKYYEEYFEVLEKKVQQQRLRNQKQREEEEKKAREKEEEKFKRHSLRKRLQRVEISHDDSYLKRIPKTDLARIVQLESRLKREGKLKTKSDQDKFWDEINQPEVFYSQFKKKKQNDGSLEPISRPGIHSSTLVQDGRSLSHISERQEASRLSHISSWAITQQFHAQNDTTSAKEKRKDSAQLSREAALELEKRFPKLEMPKMSIFSLKLGEKHTETDEQIQRRVALKAREKNRKKYMRKLQRMHQLAMAHSAASNRILEQRGDLDFILNGSDLHDVRGFYVDESDLAVFRKDYVDIEREEEDEDDVEDEDQVPHETFMTEPVFDHFTDPLPHPPPPASAGSRPSSYNSTTSSHAGRRLAPIDSDQVSSRKSSKTRKNQLAIVGPPPAAPLTYNDVLSSGKVMEAKCLSTNWVNYMHAGKDISSLS